jgi:uncharacterized membrane protein YeaQ/YmgE (transglycosylase-associated protein family)
MPGIVIWLGIWILLGLLVGALASLVLAGDPPYGLEVDILVSVATMIVVGLGDYYLLSLMDISSSIRFLIAILEPLTSAMLVVWLLRVIKRRRGEGV